MRILIACALCFLVSASQALDDKFCEPVVSTVGDHFTPRVKCIIDEENIKVKENQLLEKYMRELNVDENVKNSELIREYLRDIIEAGSRNFQHSAKCTACSAGVKLLRYVIEGDMPMYNVLDLSKKLCTDLNIMYPKMCNGIVDVYGETIFDIVNKSTHNERAICAILFNGQCYLDAADEGKWQVKIPDGKPPVKKLQENPGKPKIKVLHLSDTHWDSEYAEGTSSECRSFLCCRKESVPLPNNKELSGKFGGWKCDLPEVTFDSLISHLKNTEKDFDYIIWTGDIPAHDMWNQTETNNYDILHKTLKKLQDAFPEVPIYPALGNHESIPPNLYPTEKDNSKDPLTWLYKKVNKEWHFWLPDNNTETILRGGFYSVLVKPKLRIISMNMNYCYAMNWWLLANNVDPEKELQWLTEELLKAEKKGEKVHIIGHVPSGSTECIKLWQTNYYNIINRFENTVTAQFFGHTHTDEFEIFYDMKNTSRPLGVGYLAPSVTTYTYLNPGYRVYYIDGDYEGSSRYVLDHESWILDLQKANQDKTANWKKLYTAKEAFNMTSLFPEDWNKVYERMKTDNSTLDLYMKYYWKDSPKRTPCDENCKLKRLCDIRSCVQYGPPKF